MKYQNNLSNNATKILTNILNSIKVTFKKNTNLMKQINY